MLVFLLLPIIISLVLVSKYSEILNSPFIKETISVSGYFFSLSSLVLIFILFRSFRPSDYHKSVSDQKYLDDDAIGDLDSSLKTIKFCIQHNEVKDLVDSCNTVIHIYRSLKEHGDDLILKAYSNQIKDLFNLINKHALQRIGLTSDYEELRAISDSDKLMIWNKTDELERYLKRIHVKGISI